LPSRVGTSMSHPRVRLREGDRVPRRPHPCPSRRKNRVLADTDHHVQITGGEPLGARLPLAGELRRLPLCHSGGDFRERVFLLRVRPEPRHSGQGSLMIFPSPLHSGQGRVREKNPVGSGPDASAAVAAGLRRSAGFGAAAMTMGAALVARHLDLGLEAESCLFEADRQVVAQIVAAPAAPATPAGPEDIPEDVPNRSSKGVPPKPPAEKPNPPPCSMPACPYWS